MEMKPGQGSHTFDYTLHSTNANELQVVCDGRKLEIEFGAAAHWDRMQGARVTMTVRGVKDLANNVMLADLSWAFTVEYDTNVGARLSDVTLARRMVRRSMETVDDARARCVHEVLRELEALLRVPADQRRLHVQFVSQDPLTQFPTVSVHINGDAKISTTTLLSRLQPLWNGADRSSLEHTTWLRHVNATRPVGLLFVADSSHATAVKEQANTPHSTGLQIYQGFFSSAH